MKLGKSLTLMGLGAAAVLAYQKYGAPLMQKAEKTMNQEMKKIDKKMNQMM